MNKEISIEILMQANKNFVEKLPKDLSDEFTKLSNMSYELGKKDEIEKNNKK